MATGSICLPAWRLVPADSSWGLAGSFALLLDEGRKRWVSCYNRAAAHNFLNTTLHALMFKINKSQVTASSECTLQILNEPITKQDFKLTKSKSSPCCGSFLLSFGANTARLLRPPAFHMNHPWHYIHSLTTSPIFTQVSVRLKRTITAMFTMVYQEGRTRKPAEAGQWGCWLFIASFSAFRFVCGNAGASPQTPW